MSLVRQDHLCCLELIKRVPRACLSRRCKSKNCVSVEPVAAGGTAVVLLLVVVAALGRYGAVDNGQTGQLSVGQTILTGGSLFKRPSLKWTLRVTQHIKGRDENRVGASGNGSCKDACNSQAVHK